MNNAADDKAIRARIATLKTRDALTGLYNRAQFIRLLDSALGKPSNDNIRALLYLRPDKFGDIDERFGPTASDALLRQLATLLREHLSSNCLLARFGGNVFLALVVRREAREVQTLAEQIIGSISGHLFEVDMLSTDMTASIGAVVLSAQAQQADDAISLAQAAARQARARGGNCLHFEESADAEDSQVARWARRISAALEGDGFHLVYQPMASLDGSPSFNYDVLLRMLDDEQQHVLPGEFIPAAERAGLMPKIDRWVIRRAFGLAASRHAEGKKTCIFVRLAEATLRDREFFAWLGLEALEHRLDRDSVVLQVAERVTERCLPMVRELAGVCTDLHLKLSLADPGPDGRCLKLVQELPLDFLVLQGDYIKGIEPSRLDALLSLAADKGVRVIATHIEGAADLARLYSLGVHYVVGFHVHEPDEEFAEDFCLPESDSQHSSRSSRSGG